MVLVLLVLYKNMEFRIETWSINKLIEEYNSKKLELNPEYQRRFIWSLKDQRTLINSIFSGYAIPNIFLYDTERKLEVVDGQQRIRTILGYYLGIFVRDTKNIKMGSGADAAQALHMRILKNYMSYYLKIDGSK